MTPRQKAYFFFRGSSAGIFLISATLLPRGAPAVIGCVVAGMGGLLTCLGVNAGGPGERSGAHAQANRYEQARAPQGDWPPFDPSHDIEGDVVRER